MPVPTLRSAVGCRPSKILSRHWNSSSQQSPKRRVDGATRAGLHAAPIPIPSWIGIETT